MKEQIPWGRAIATVLAVGALAVSVSFVIPWWQMRAECADAERTVLAVLPNAFGTDGTVETDFSPKYDFTCKEMLVVEHGPPNRSRDDVMATVKELRAHLAIVDRAGKVVREEEVTDERFCPFWTKPGSNSVLPAFMFRPVPPGDCRLRLTVTQPAIPLADVPHQIVVRYGLCGIEYLATALTGGIALVAALIGLALTTGVIVVTRKKRKHSNKSDERDGF
ncbi:MAG: hypothetical protein JXB10_18880 [Pirellulales bacterium]|nr:hypothetical protein [Pirellulales bacterium]